MRRVERWTNILNEFFWYRVPTFTRKIHPRFEAISTDGLYLIVWPRFAALLPLILVITGCLLGAFHPGYERVFSESLMVVLLIVGLGTISANLGLCFLIGYIVGDFFVFHDEWLHRSSLWQHILKIRVPLLIKYALMGLILVQLPLLVKGLLASVRPPRWMPVWASFSTAIIGHMVLTVILVFLWTQAVPQLIRPVFTWPSGSPTRDAMEVLQLSFQSVLWFAAIASLFRMSLQTLTTVNLGLRDSLDEWAWRLVREEEPKPGPLAKLGFVKGLWGGIWLTLILSGLYESWNDVLQIFMTVTVLHLAREKVIKIPLGPLPYWMWKIPLLVRLAIATGIVAGIGSLVLEQMLRRTSSFQPIMLVTIIGLVVFFLFTTVDEKTEESPKDHAQEPA